jgi:hypothetical protein
MDIQANVNRGMALLDAQYPGWDAKVDVDTLALGSCANCVLGQLVGAGVVDTGSYVVMDFSRYTVGRDALRLTTQAAEFHGFTLTTVGRGAAGPKAWLDLTNCWKAAILARRAAPVETAFIEQLKADLTTCT